VAIAGEGQIGAGLEGCEIRFITVVPPAGFIFIIVAAQRKLVFLFYRRGVLIRGELKGAFDDQRKRRAGRQDVSG